MPAKKLVFGPNDLNRLLSAGNVKPIHRIQVDVTVDALGNLSAIKAYPVDSAFIEIVETGSDFRANGCPYPPDCGTISFIGGGPDVEKCKMEIENASSVLGIH